MGPQKEKKKSQIKVQIKQEYYAVTCTSASTVNTPSGSTSTMSKFKQLTVKSERDCKPLVPRSSSSSTVTHGKTPQQSKSQKKSSPDNIGGSLSRTKLEFKIPKVRKPSGGPTLERKLPATPAAPTRKEAPSSTSSCNAQRRPSGTSKDVAREVPPARRHSVSGGTIQIEAQGLPQRITGRRSSGPVQPRRKRQLGESEPFGFEFRKHHRHIHQQKRQEEMFRYIHDIPAEAFDSD